MINRKLKDENKNTIIRNILPVKYLKVHNMGKKAWEDIIVIDTNDILGRKIIKTLGEIRIKCNATKDKKVGKLAEFRGEAPNKLKKIAYKLGANSIIGARFEYRGGDLVYEGTAVILEDED